MYAFVRASVAAALLAISRHWAHAIGGPGPACRVQSVSEGACVSALSARLCRSAGRERSRPGHLNQFATFAAAPYPMAGTIAPKDATPPITKLAVSFTPTAFNFS